MGRGPYLCIWLLAVAACGGGCATPAFRNPWAASAPRPTPPVESKTGLARLDLRNRSRPSEDSAEADAQDPKSTARAAARREPESDRRSRANGKSKPEHDATTLALIESELRDATPEERAEVEKQLQGVPSSMVPRLLSVRRAALRTADAGDATAGKRVTRAAFGHSPAAPAAGPITRTSATGLGTRSPWRDTETAPGPVITPIQTTAGKPATTEIEQIIAAAAPPAVTHASGEIEVTPGMPLLPGVLPAPDAVQSASAAPEQITRPSTGSESSRLEMSEPSSTELHIKPAPPGEASTSPQPPAETLPVMPSISVSQPRGVAVLPPASHPQNAAPQTTTPPADANPAAAAASQAAGGSLWSQLIPGQAHGKGLPNPFFGNDAQKSAASAVPALTAGLNAALGSPAFEQSAAAPGAPPDPRVWQENLQRLIAATELEVAQLTPGDTEPQKQAFIERHVYLRMLYLMAGQQERALQYIPAIDQADQEFWQQVFWGIASYFDSAAVPNSPDRATQTIAQLQGAILRLKEKAHLELRNVSFCHKIASFGDYERYPRDEFSPGQEVLLYAELGNFFSEVTPDGRYRTLLRSTLEIRNPGPNGEVVDQINYPAPEDLCRNHRRDYFLSYKLVIPQRIALGPHVLKLTVEDQLSRKQVTSTLNFTVR